MSYLEIYIEEVRDILSKNPEKRLEVRERPDIGVYVKDISSFVVKNVDDMEKLMSIGSKNSESKFCSLVVLYYNYSGTSRTEKDSFCPL